MARRDAIATALRNLAPQSPDHEFDAVIDHAVDSPGLRKAAPVTAAWLSMVSYVRHVMTDYDSLLADGYDTESARHFVLAEIDDVLQAWGVRRRVGEEDDGSKLG